MNAQRDTEPSGGPDHAPRAASVACGEWPIAICSWSLRSGVDEVARSMGQLGVGRVNLAMKPIFGEGGEEYLDAVARQRWVISATTLGFPQEDYSSLESIRATAESLRALLERLDHPALGVNFDPANMVLYDKGDPVAALRLLGRWIMHIHIKDAVRTARPGTWGREVPWGEGEVGGGSFLDALKEIGYAGALAIERESGDDRLGDVRVAIERLVSWAGRPTTPPMRQRDLA
jgi:sugar phosphate isomerase/epimerase